MNQPQGEQAIGEFIWASFRHKNRASDAQMNSHNEASGRAYKDGIIIRRGNQPRMSGIELNKEQMHER